MKSNKLIQLQPSLYSKLLLLLNLEKLFGSKTRSDILKYLVFRRQGVSIRALESELGRTFPGIKKQIDGLEDAEVLHIDKTPEKRAIKIRDDVYEEIRKLILVSLKGSIKSYLQHIPLVQKLYFGKLFDKQIEVDLVILYQGIETPEELNNLKKDITNIFKSYLIDPAYLVFMDTIEFEKRTKMADKFALSLVRSNQ